MLNEHSCADLPLTNHMCSLTHAVIGER